jgi:hypothetical protein
LCLGRATTRSHSSQWSKKNVVRNTIFRKAPPSIVSGYGKRSINLNKVVATFEKHIFLSQTDLTRTGIISNSYNEMTLNQLRRTFDSDSKTEVSTLKSG